VPRRDDVVAQATGTADASEDDQEDHLDVVQFFLDLAHLVVYLPMSIDEVPLVLKDLGVVATVERKSHHLLSVPQGGLPQQQIVESDVLQLLVFETDLAVELVKIGLGRVHQAAPF
jgi:hypothetical protein